MLHVYRILRNEFLIIACMIYRAREIIMSFTVTSIAMGMALGMSVGVPILYPDPQGDLPQSGRDHLSIAIEHEKRLKRPRATPAKSPGQSLRTRCRRLPRRLSKELKSISERITNRNRVERQGGKPTPEPIYDSSEERLLKVWPSLKWWSSRHPSKPQASKEDRNIAWRSAGFTGRTTERQCGTFFKSESMN